MILNQDNLCGLDFETYGSVNLPTCGLDNYVSDQFFRPLIARVVSVEGTQYRQEVLDFIKMGHVRNDLLRAINGRFIAAHNAPFEQRVLASMGVDLPDDQFIDTAVIARAAGAGSSLEAAAPQLLASDKMEAGRDLIKLFSIPGEYQEKNGSLAFDPLVVYDNSFQWDLFGDYCYLDARLSLELAFNHHNRLTDEEYVYSQVTDRMNRIGWHVDVPLVKEMQRRYEDNLARAIEEFRVKEDEPELNFNSLKQMKEWCARRGVKATSFDEKHVASLLKRVTLKLEDPDLKLDKIQDYTQVQHLLQVKQILGGSSLKKLKVILENVGSDSRLRNQYLHAGAGQTLRTSGRSVQMQNLKRLTTPLDMEELHDPAIEWDNTQMAENLRQVFTATDPRGRLIVGDFSSVESRGLAYQSGEDWKLQAYQQNQDLYKVLASKIYGVPYEQITKLQRQTGKVGELSCGYQAGPDAVLEFAKNMGVNMSEGESAKLVYDWRDANPKTVEYWDVLDSLLRGAVINGATGSHPLPHDSLMVIVSPITTPASLSLLHPNAQSIEVQIHNMVSKKVLLKRYFHGCYVRGRSLCYYKPSARKTGDLWSSNYVDPKTKMRKYYSIYGGKLSGILTQSLCREIFFRVLTAVENWTQLFPNIRVVGQFHDEIVLDWTPPQPLQKGVPLLMAEEQITQMMSQPGGLHGFPLAAEIKSAYRYIK